MVELVRALDRGGVVELQQPVSVDEHHADVEHSDPDEPDLQLHGGIG
jgi:hypothetical protein